MNYGKKSVQIRLRELDSGRSLAVKKLALNISRVLLLFFIVFFICGLGVMGIYTGQLIRDTPDIRSIDISPSGYSTSILDRNGKEIEVLYGEGANRRYISIDDMPKDLQNAFVSVEDERFYEHGGIDPRGILRAGIVGILGGGDFSQGASTITQQLLKNNFFISWTKERDLPSRVKRKIREQYLATELEKIMTKDEILENYLNTINLGAGTLGVEAASERYFNKKAQDLTLSEASVLAGITKNPTLYNPIKNPSENAARRLIVLGNMLKLGFINQAQYNDAIEDDVYERIELAASETEDLPTSYFTDALIVQVVSDLIEQCGYSETEAWQKLYTGGLTIKSTQDSKIQAICDEEIENEKNYKPKTKYSFFYRATVQHPDGSYDTYNEQTMLSHFREKDPDYSIVFPSRKKAEKALNQYKKEILKEGDVILDDGESIVFTPQPQVALSLIDQNTGAVVALCGGRGKKTGSRTLNRATDITRQPGSTFKILSTFAPALDSAGQTLATVQEDAPYKYSDGTDVNNYDGKYRGYTTMRESITKSINVCTVKTLTQIGTGLGFEYVRDFGISTLESGDNTQALALGGITNGVKNIELTAAYAAIADHGTYRQPKYYSTVLDHDGRTLLSSSDDATRKVLDETTAWLLTDAMRDVLKKGTGKAADFTGSGEHEMAVAGKTGTTSLNRDSVFVGYTPYYTCGIWGGFDDNTPQKNGEYHYPRKIWRQVMKRIHADLESKDFDMPPGIVEKDVCRKSGLLPLKGVCSHDPRGSMVYTEYFSTRTTPDSSCDNHTKVTICSSSGLPAGEYCPKKYRDSGIFMIDGEGEDKKYSLSKDILSKSCDKHTREWYDKHKKKKE